MTLRFTPSHWMDDAHSAPDAQTPEGIRFVNVRRGTNWQAEHHSVYHCEHGSYVGYERVFAYKCPECPEFGTKPPTPPLPGPNEPHGPQPDDIGE